MINVEVFNKLKQEKVSIKSTRDLLWYDDKKKKLRKFKGDKIELRLVYGKRTNRWRSVPKIITERIEKVEKIDDKSVINWFDKYSNYNDSSADIISEDKNSVIFNVKESELDDFLYSLDRENIDYNKD